MKTILKLITALSLFIFTSCGSSWYVSTINHDPIYDDVNYVMVSDNVKIDTLTDFQFRNKLRTDFNFRLDFARYAISQPRSFDWNNRILGNTYNWNRNNWGYSYYNYWDRDRMWNDWAWGFTPHRWSPFGYDRWGYNSGWNSWNSPYYGWYGSHFNNYYGGWPYYGNNVYGIPRWRRSNTNVAYVNGRRSSINSEVSNNRRVRTNNRTRNNNNTKPRGYGRPENNRNNSNSTIRNNRNNPNSTIRSNRNNSRPTINNNNRSTVPIIRNNSSSPRTNSTPTRRVNSNSGKANIKR